MEDHPGFWVPGGNSVRQRVSDQFAAQVIGQGVADDQDPSQWAAQQLTQNVTMADQTEVTRLNAEMAASGSTQSRATMQIQIDKLTAQIGAATNPYDSLLQTARDGIGDQQ
jgi:hypothetical protein